MYRSEALSLFRRFIDEPLLKPGGVARALGGELLLAIAPLLGMEVLSASLRACLSLSAESGGGRLIEGLLLLSVNVLLFRLSSKSKFVRRVLRNFSLVFVLTYFLVIWSGPPITADLATIAMSSLFFLPAAAYLLRLWSSRSGGSAREGALTT